MQKLAAVEQELRYRFAVQRIDNHASQERYPGIHSARRDNTLDQGARSEILLSGSFLISTFVGLNVFVEVKVWHVNSAHGTCRASIIATELECFNG